MFSDIYTRYHSYHEEYTRKSRNLPEPLDQPRHGLKEAIGQGLIHLGERLARVERPQPVEKAA
jgi:hypothetical protein